MDQTKYGGSKQGNQNVSHHNRSYQMGYCDSNSSGIHHRLDCPSPLLVFHLAPISLLLLLHLVSLDLLELMVLLIFLSYPCTQYAQCGEDDNACSLLG